MWIRRGVLTGVALLLGWGSVAGASTAVTAPLRVHLALRTQHVTSGQPIKGTVTFTNTTQERITVNTCASDGWLEVGLRK